MNSDLVTIAAGLCFDSLLITSLKNQQAPLSTRVLNRCPHERVDQFLQDDLARHCLRDFDHRSQIQVFDRCADRARWTRSSLFLPEERM
jgi:hypothetical protein